MGLQARELYRFTKKNNIKVGRMGQRGKRDKNFAHCVLGVVAHMTNETDTSRYADKSIRGLDPRDRHSLEAGFEGWSDYMVDTPKNRVYYNVGKNFARLCGLHNRTVVF